MTIEELIAELENTGEGLRELDRKVRAISGDVLIPWRALTKPLQGQPEWDGPPAASNSSYLPFYTRSIDAAMTLVPEGLEWAKRRLSKQYSCILKVGTDAAIGLAPTEALAICIASLRARSRQP